VSSAFPVASLILAYVLV